MELIRTIDDLKANIKVMDNYLSSKDHEEINYAKERVKNGHLFCSGQLKNRIQVLSQPFYRLC